MRTLASLLALTTVVLACAACSDTGPLMRPGDDCMTCHGNAGRRGWTVAGTVFSTPTSDVNLGADGVTVLITDANGKQLTLTSNAAGNFYTNAAVTFPIAAEFHRGANVMKMTSKVQTGACSSCHTEPPQNSAPGRNYIAP